MIDPATEHEWGAVPDCSAEDVDAALAAAGRAALLLRAADEL